MERLANRCRQLPRPSVGQATYPANLGPFPRRKSNYLLGLRRRVKIRPDK